MTRARWISVANLVVIAMLVLLWTVLNTAYREVPRSPDEPAAAFALFGLALAVLFAGVGAIVVRRQPSNAVGWIFCALGFVYAEGIALVDYLWVARYEGFASGLNEPLAWFADVTFQSPASFGFYAFFFLLFPDGRLPTPRWRILARLAALSVAGLFVSVAFRADVLTTIPIQNPLGIEALDPVRLIVDLVSFGGLVIALLGSVASLIVRLRRSRGDERQQLKWFLTAAGVLTLVIAIAPFTFFTPRFPQWAWPLVLLGSLSLIPIAAGVAITKYRLYEIDVIVNRALVYAALTAILAGSYLSIVVIMQRLVTPFTRDSDLAVAASTLAVAALFRPLRARLQTFIDRRFYRRKYDSVQTLDEFTSRLRDDIDIDSLRTELVAVIRTTMQPAHASVWLRTEASR